MENPELKPTSNQTSKSPRWSATTKLVVALIFVAVFAGLLIRFRHIVGPLLIALVLAFLVYPLAEFLHRRLKFSWQLAVVLIFLVILLIFLGLLTLGGFAIVDQVQSLIVFLQTQIKNLPTLVTDLTSKPLVIGPFEIDFSTLDLTAITNQLLSFVQPLLSNSATLVGKVAAGAATTVAWSLFALIVSYFILAESGGVRQKLLNLQIPGYGDDLARMSRELGRIWNAFLRGQLILFGITLLIYITLLGSLQVNFYFGLAILAGLARFVPYIGPWITWITYFLVALLQGGTIFGLESFPYAIVVVGVALVVDTVMDNFLVPRVMGNALKVHPAAVMVAAIISASLFGLIGVLLAAPVLATLKLISDYAIRKLFDLEPWTGIETIADTPPPLLRNWPVFVARVKTGCRLAVKWVKTKWPVMMAGLSKASKWFTNAVLTLWHNLKQQKQDK